MSKKIVIIFGFISAFFVGYFFHNINFNDSVVEQVKIETGVVKFVIDGDTFVLTSGEKVRLLGIDTPEKNEDFYEEAKQELKKLIGSKEVVLKRDVSEKDKYNRLLRHVYIEDIWVNKKLVQDGLAEAMIIPPDVSHVNILKDVEQEAKNNKKGIWKY